jgi:NAD(P)-dependent dehydrogenase (short-subunit alcohol dehydrogenase family)
MKKKTIVITGSTKGIGLGLAREFMSGGHRLVINGRDKNRLFGVLAELKRISPDVCGVAGSVSAESTHEALVEKAVSEFGGIDIWINNAGVPQPHMDFMSLDTCHLHQLPEVNITGLM